MQLIKLIIVNLLSFLFIMVRKPILINYQIKNTTTNWY